ncbi:MAG: dephospho-CoA kinase [Sulfuriferula sp.]|nr:dephospho-CoA kinase [Sulfuriferula sp.]
MKPIIGLTGGIGCGKTTVSDLLIKLGITVIDTDEISRAITDINGIAVSAIKRNFGSDYITAQGALDRTRMRELVFNDPAAKQQLEAILHPLIQQQVIADIQQTSHAPYTVISVPLLLETQHYVALTTRVLVVDCSEEQQIARVTTTRNITAEMVRKVMASQISRQIRLQYADDIIDNQHSYAATQAQVLALHQKYLNLWVAD